MTMDRAELQRLYDDCQDGRYGHLVALVDGVRRFLGEPDPTVEIAYLKATLADVEADVVELNRQLDAAEGEVTKRSTPDHQERRPPMSHDDIKAALESRSDLPWRPSHGGPVATRPSDTYDVYDCDGDVIAASLFYLDAHLIANAPTWLAELLAENERLTARAEAAEAERDQLREEARKFAQALGFGDGRTEPAATLAGLVDPLTEAMSDSREHQECPVFCELCGERLAAVTCEACRGSGCLPNAEMAYLECGTCAGVGKVHNGCAEMTYAQLAASAEAAEQTIQRVRELAQHYDGRAYTDATGAILRALDGGEQP